jgi:hypothetical protein
MRLYRKASWEEGGSEVAAAVALLSLGTGEPSVSPVKEDAGGTSGVWDDLFLNRDDPHGVSGGLGRGLFSSTSCEPAREQSAIG